MKLFNISFLRIKIKKEEVAVELLKQQNRTLALKRFTNILLL
jgi:hypothetical protein